ncbi:MAG: PHP domain-containing protein [Actinomycetaceae bacterium]|nr:PHP domain-containing protein [Actinomycetaceae bacterium]
MTGIDPHTHSCFSDGTDTPTQLMEKAARAGLSAVGLTDHDTVAGWEEASAAVPVTGVSLLRGMEVTCRGQGVSVHLLSYLHDPSFAPLARVCEATIESRLGRARQMVENLSADFPITWEQVQSFAPADGPVGRPHIADALVSAGCFPDRAACFTHVLHPRGPYYVSTFAPEAVEAVELVRAAGGVAVLAHPRARARQKLLPVSVIADMVDAGLAGIECFHRDHGEEDVAQALQLADRFGLFVTGSSDYHGWGKPNQLGENTTSVEALSCIEEAGKLEVIRA